MVRLIKALALVVAVIAGVAGAAAVWFFSSYPKVAPPRTLEVEVTPARLARGAYLATHVTGCVDCHSRRDFTHYAGPVIAGTEGVGGERFDAHNGGVPGVLYAPNITPAGVGRWTDGELARAITEGVSRDGRALFPLMPWPAFATLCEDDLEALIAWTRRLKAQESIVPASRLELPMRLMVRTMPRPVTVESCPEQRTEVETGAYLVGVAGCADCHTPMARGKPVPGRAFAGGVAFTFPDGSVARSANLTPDRKTGIGGWDRESFIARFKSHLEGPAMAVGPGDPQTPMPWHLYAGMTEADLGAIFAWLETVPKVVHEVEHFTPAPAKTAER